jgi:hypothetical protein
MISTTPYAAHSQLAGSRLSSAENDATQHPTIANLFLSRAVVVSKANSGVQL